MFLKGSDFRPKNGKIRRVPVTPPGYFAAKFLHRYVYINANMTYVVYQPVTRKKKKR